MLNVLQFDGSPIDDAMLEIQVLVGDAHAVYVRVGDILPVEDHIEFKFLWAAIHTWDPDREWCSQIHALSLMELGEERAPYRYKKVILTKKRQDATKNFQLIDHWKGFLIIINNF